MQRSRKLSYDNCILEEESFRELTWTIWP